MARPDRTYCVALRLFSAHFRLMGYQITVQGADNIPSHGPAVVATNHTSFLDFVMVGYVARVRGRLVRFMSKASVFDKPVVGRWMRSMRHIKVNRATGASAYRRATGHIERGQLVGVFPEATISRSWQLKQFKRGAAGLAVSQGVPVIPVIVWGAHRIWTVDGRRSWRRKIPISITVGEPLLAAEDETVDAFNDRLRQVMESMLDQAIDQYQDGTPEGQWWLPHDKSGSAPTRHQAAELDRAAVARLGDTFEDQPDQPAEAP
jgi:1-acyl-sn-glycerol-3-phosphate acyltransferase